MNLSQPAKKWTHGTESCDSPSGGLAVRQSKKTDLQNAIKSKYALRALSSGGVMSGFVCARVARPTRGMIQHSNCTKVVPPVKTVWRSATIRQRQRRKCIRHARGAVERW